MWMRLGLLVVIGSIAAIAYSFLYSDGDGSTSARVMDDGPELSSEVEFSDDLESPGKTPDANAVAVDVAERSHRSGSTGPGRAPEETGDAIAPEFGAADVYMTAPEEGVPQIEGPAPEAFDSGAPGSAPEAFDSGTLGLPPEAS